MLRLARAQLQPLQDGLLQRMSDEGGSVRYLVVSGNEYNEGCSESLAQRAEMRGSSGTAFGHARTREPSPWVQLGLSSPGPDTQVFAEVAKAMLAPLLSTGGLETATSRDTFGA